MPDSAARAARPLGPVPPGPAPLTGPEATAALLDKLAGWLPRQRWFPGRDDRPGALRLISDVALQAGFPALRHLIVEASLRSGPARFQVLVGYRPGLPPALHDALIGSVGGVACYDALHDPELADVLLHGISEQRLAGQLRFVREAGTPSLVRGSLAGRVLGAEQSNTSLVFGDHAILKVLRRLFPGTNPDLEVADALARLGSNRVAAPYGWIETDLDGEPVLLGVLSQFLTGASDGWILALDSLHALAATGADPTGLEPPGSTPFAAEARLLGHATAELHADLAQAFGSRELTAAELAGVASAMQGKLSDAVDVVPGLAAHEARIRAAYDAFARLPGPVIVQRIHGDYHLGQVLRAQHGWVALDFEGEPAVPLAARRGLAPALRDVAGMLRSFDYAARHETVGEPAEGRLAVQASGWVRQCHDAFCAGYAAAGGADPAGHRALLRALTLEKAVYEVVYEYRHRPSWLAIPLSFLAAA
ncbi:MAG: maltokinase N-terminal cap-like domain-containing protein [Streptosporangiaceae bacterium]